MAREEALARRLDELIEAVKELAAHPPHEEKLEELKEALRKLEERLSGERNEQADQQSGPTLEQRVEELTERVDELNAKLGEALRDLKCLAEGTCSIEDIRSALQASHDHDVRRILECPECVQNLTEALKDPEVRARILGEQPQPAPGDGQAEKQEQERDIWWW